MSASSDCLIRVDNVVKRYGTFAALKGISMEIGQGEFVALLGPSGCGKTTLLRLIAGFIDPSEGSITIDGTPMMGLPPNKRPVNTVFQNYALFPHLNVGRNVAFGPKRRGQDAAEIEREVKATLELVGLSGFEERFPNELSGGQQQRVALARAVINKPRVLLLDEPFGALDLQLRKRMQLELKHLQARLGITFIFVTHDQEEALVMANRIAVMNEGLIIQTGSGEDIYRAPNSRFVASFIGEANLLNATNATDGLRLDGTTDVLPYTANGSAKKVVMIRPEDIEVGPAPDENHVGLDVTVLERVFLGGATRIHADFGGDQPLVFQPSKFEERASLEPGHRLTIHWQRDRGRVLDA
ncbi:spermidine/putrescine transport system ATP-binding protein [Rhodoligotrophos appendicifer]|uniref:ABC transporter ATP-binding protein n=1 Tax=Rhodoligotrophos appendicifer TaxID=987056 RepID=UPI001FEA2B52|nr:ABC transporter ATP-binding protein [Rhodoligotrophos appendicifer]